MMLTAVGMPAGCDGLQLVRREDNVRFLLQDLLFDPRVLFLGQSRLDHASGYLGSRTLHIDTHLVHGWKRLGISL